MLCSQISLASTQQLEDIQEVFRADTGAESVDIWELATQIDKDIPDDIWEVVCEYTVVTRGPTLQIDNIVYR